MRRKKLKVQFPNGYPYVLVQVANKSTKKFVLATSEAQALKRAAMKTARIVPVQVFELIENNGHAEANAFLKEFGQTWMCKEGKVFFKELD